MNSAIRTKNLRKRFRTVDALAGLNLDIAEGAIYALVGPNGAGKTTTIKILMNIFRPTGGAAEILGIDSRKIAARTLASIGYVSEKGLRDNDNEVTHLCCCSSKHAMLSQML